MTNWCKEYYEQSEALEFGAGAEAPLKFWLSNFIKTLLLQPSPNPGAHSLR